MVIVTSDHAKKTVLFTSKNGRDAVSYRGTVESTFATHDVAVGFGGDVRAYNTEVRKSDPSVPADPTKLSFFIIKLDNPDAVPPLRAFAQEWIAPGSFSVIDDRRQVHLIVYDRPDQNPSRIVDFLKTGGFEATIESIT